VAALDDQIRETVNRLLDSLRGHLDTELGASRDELIQAARDEGARIAAEAAEAATAVARREAEQQLTEMRESVVRDAEEQRRQLSAEIEDLQRRLDEVREDSQRRIDDGERRLEESQRRIEDGQKEILAAREETESAREDVEAAREEARTAREETEAARGEVAAARKEIAALENDLETARQQLDETRDDVEATLRDIELSRRDSDAARDHIRRLSESLRRMDERTSQALRLPDAVRTLDEAATFGEALENLAVRAGREAGRAVVFLVKGKRLRDWRAVGFDFASDARLDLDLSESEPMADAVRSGQCVHPRRGMQVPDFARTSEGREAAAWPISVGGSVVAVLYADAPVADKSDEPYWPAFLDVLARHAGRVLEGITVRQAAGLVTGRVTGVAPSSISRQASGSTQ
jgi:uncharacterized coiled-coil DUF342 family protein